MYPAFYRRNLAMKTYPKQIAFLASLIVIGVSIPVMPPQAEEVDYSCMRRSVVGKIQVIEKLKEYDVILENRCPGPVYWSVCIERMDPWTNEILETHALSGQAQADKKSRINMQMEKSMDASQSRHAYQEFYVNFEYAIKPPANGQCVASECEPKKQGLRAEIRTNYKAWQKVINALAAQLSTECSESSWDSSAQDSCEAEIRKTRQPELDLFAQKEKELKGRLAVIDRERCQVYGGG
jgi:hypothetical protein